jgi:hypothetical protein
MAGNHSKHTKETWEKLRLEYFAGTYKTLSELAEKYQVQENSLRSKISQQEWNKQKEEMQSALSNKVKEKLEMEAVDEVKMWIEKVKKRTSADWNIIDRSLDNIGSEVDAEALLPYIRARKLLDDMHRRALGLSEPSQSLDLTSKGQSLGDSLVSAIAKLRAQEDRPKLTDEDKQRILEAEIVDDNSCSNKPSI